MELSFRGASEVTRRRFLMSGAIGLSTLAVPRIAWAQSATEPPLKRAAPDEYSVAAPVSIDVNARPIASFDRSDRAHVRFGSRLCENGLQ